MEPLDLDELRAGLDSDDYEPIGEVRAFGADEMIALYGPVLLREN
ncbi:MAG: hypothetical protein JWM87_699 [Candidatus Eremiobacteraeota bacterium]|nr:hypothetical protein [Candidatus Eremiobacteraeota bacterium]